MKAVHIPDEEFIRKMMGTAPNAPVTPQVPAGTKPHRERYLTQPRGHKR